jgi:hypothetical protein
MKLMLREDPKCLQAYAGLGEVYLQTGNWAEVALNAQAMTKLGPFGAEEAAVQIGQMRMRQNLLEAAYVHLLAAARRLPHSRRIKEMLAEVMRVRR